MPIRPGLGLRGKLHTDGAAYRRQLADAWGVLLACCLRFGVCVCVCVCVCLASLGSRAKSSYRLLEASVHDTLDRGGSLHLAIRATLVGGTQILETVPESGNWAEECRVATTFRQCVLMSWCDWDTNPNPPRYRCRLNMWLASHSDVRSGCWPSDGCACLLFASTRWRAAALWA